GGAKQSFETTFRVVCFAEGSASPLLVIPFCGGLITGIWKVVLYCIGLARSHETDTGRAVIAVFLPLIVCCGGGLLIAFMFGALEWNPLVFTALCGVMAFDLYAFATLATRAPRLRICFCTQRVRTFVRFLVISAFALNWIYLLSHWRDF